MTAILDIPEVRQRISPISVEEYHRLNEFNENGRRTELIRGLVVEKMSKSPLHSFIGKRLYDVLLARVPAGCLIRREDPLTLHDSEPEPDIAIVRGSEAEFAEKHPDTAELVIEVAVLSAALNRENAAVYAEAGVKEYWIVLPAIRSIEVFAEPKNGVYAKRRTVDATSEIDSTALPGLSLCLTDILP